jgi:rod shape-determining protein MreC
MATPLFRQGASPNAKLFLYAVASICVLAVDSRVRLLEPTRQVISTVIYPMQQLMLLPRAGINAAGEWLEDQGSLSRRAAKLEKDAVLATHLSQQAQALSAENAELRAMLALRQRGGMTIVAADILYETRDAVTRKVVIDRGLVHSMAPGMPVVATQGLIGQVVRTYPLTSEVNLIIDRDQATPVQVARNGLRAVAYGGVEGGMLEIRFMAGNADIKEGDELYTSGLDGVYPANLPVAKVVQIERSTAVGFARIVCQPLAGVTQHRHVAVVTSIPKLPDPPPKEELDDKKRGKKPKPTVPAPSTIPAAGA